MDCTYISSYLQYLQSLLVKPLVFRGPDPLLGTEDGYQLYEFDLSSASSKHIACPKLHGRVKDISLSCTAEGCSPVALTGNHVIHCQHGPMTIEDDLEHFTVSGDGATRPEHRFGLGEMFEFGFDMGYLW